MAHPYAAKFYFQKLHKECRRYTVWHSFVPRKKGVYKTRLHYLTKLGFSYSEAVGIAKCPPKP